MRNSQLVKEIKARGLELAINPESRRHTVQHRELRLSWNTFNGRCRYVWAWRSGWPEPQHLHDVRSVLDLLDQEVNDAQTA